MTLHFGKSHNVQAGLTFLGGAKRIHTSHSLQRVSDRPSVSYTEHMISIACGGTDLGRGVVNCSPDAQFMTTSQESHQQSTRHGFTKVNRLRQADNPKYIFWLYLCGTLWLQWAVVKRFLFRTIWSQDSNRPRRRRGAA